MSARERATLAVAALAHVGLLAALSVTATATMDAPAPPPPALAIDLSEIADAPRAAAPPRDAQAPAPATPSNPRIEPTPAVPEPTRAVPEPAAVPAQPAPPSREPPRSAAPTPPEPARAEPARPRPARVVPVAPARADPDAIARALDRQLAAPAASRGRTTPRPPRREPDAGALASALDGALRPAPAAPPRARPGPAQTAQPQVATLSPIAASTLAAAITGQIKPCWTYLPGSEDMVVRLRVRLARTGAVEGAVEVLGVTGGNPAMQRTLADAARRAVLQCAPFRLPPDQYAYWRDIAPRFFPKEMQ